MEMRAPRSAYRLRRSFFNICCGWCSEMAGLVVVAEKVKDPGSRKGLLFGGGEHQPSLCEQDGLLVNSQAFKHYPAMVDGKDICPTQPAEPFGQG